MKKTFLTSVVALLCAITCIFAFSACADKGESTNKYVNESPDVTDFEWTEFQTKIADSGDIGGNCTVRVTTKGSVSDFLGMNLTTYDTFIKFDNVNLRYQILSAERTSTSGDYLIKSAITYDFKENKYYSNGVEGGSLDLNTDEAKQAAFDEIACFVSPAVGNKADYNYKAGTMSRRSSAVNLKTIQWKEYSIPEGMLTLWWSNQTARFEGFTSQHLAWIEVDVGLMNDGNANENIVYFYLSDFYSTVVNVETKAGDTFQKIYNN